MTAGTSSRHLVRTALASLILALAVAIPLGFAPAATSVAIADEAVAGQAGPATSEGVADPTTASPDGVPEVPTALPTDEGTTEGSGAPIEGNGPDGDVETLAENAPTMDVQVLDGERRVVLTVSGGAADAASALRFDVWSERGGRESSLVGHGAVRLADGSWQATAFIASSTPVEPGVPYNCRIQGAVHRLDNPYTGQHLYTTSVDEADDLSRGGWAYEGVAWIEPAADAEAVPVYRLYNPYTGDHFYTTDEAEFASLPSDGWQQEDVAFRAIPAVPGEGDAGQPVYRLFNPYAQIGAHLFTTSEDECRALETQGWTRESVGWRGAGANAEGTWSLPSGARPHNDSGAYHVEAVAISAEDDGANPTETLVAEGSFAVTAPTASVAVANVNEDEGSFDVVVGDIQSVSGVTAVYVPVWTAADQGDIVWYPATPRGDGTYLATVRAVDHRLAHDYTIHAYVAASNGLLECVGQTSASLALEHYMVHEAGPSRYPNTHTLTIVIPGPATSVQMPTWSEAGGQDDIVWYEATREGDRWTARIDTSRLLHSGRVTTHVYVDGQVVRGFSFDVPDNEVLQPWQKAIVNAAQTTPSLGGGRCAGWVSTVLYRAGLPCKWDDDANDMYYRLNQTNLDDILPGMAIAVSTHGHTAMGSRWGHVGIYIGDGVVMDDVGYVRRSSLLWWVQWYGDRVPVRFGFLNY